MYNAKSLGHPLGPSQLQNFIICLSSRQKQARNWCFTLNNPTTSEEQELVAMFEAHEQGRYLVYQLELGESGTPHLQGYIEFTRPWRFNRVKNLISDRCHLEPRRGTRTEARDYCMKEDTRISGPVELGRWIEDCQRCDVEEYYSHVRLLATNLELMELDPIKFGSYCKATHRVRAETMKAIQFRRWNAGKKPFVCCIWGATGTGKSRAPLDKYGPEKCCIPPSGDGSEGSIWWDNYEGQPVIILDDFYGGRMRPDYLLRQCDYPKGCPVQIKTGITYLIPQVIIFTSNTHPENWYRVNKLIPKFDNGGISYELSGGVPQEVFDAIIRRFINNGVLCIWHIDEFDVTSLPNLVPQFDFV